MTDREIIEMLKHCGSPAIQDCDECKIERDGKSICVDTLILLGVDLVERQEAAIAALRAEVEGVRRHHGMAIAVLQDVGAYTDYIKLRDNIALVEGEKDDGI